MHISSRYAKILGETNFRAREIPRSGSKAEDGGKKKRGKRRERGAKVGDNNGQATHGARRHVWRTQAAWANISGKRMSSGEIIMIQDLSKWKKICWRNTNQI